MLLNELITPEQIVIPLRARTKDELLRELVEVATGAEQAAGNDVAEEVLRAVREREAVLSTGIGNGVAIPHGKSSALATLRLAAGRTAEPVDFDALDGQPVYLFFMLLGPETAAGMHIKALSRISRLVRKQSVRERLAAAQTPEEFFQVLVEVETG